MKRTLLAGALALACLVAPAWAQTYKDSGGTIIPGLVVVDPAAPNGGGTGALGTAANPLHTTASGGGGGSVTQGTSPWVDNITQWASGVLGAMANYGTSPGAVLVPGVNAFVTNSNANGQATAANSSPVVQPADNGASTTALANSLVVSASAASLSSYYCNAITGGTAGYCIAYNGTAAPGTGPLTGANVLDVCYFNNPAGCSLSYPVGKPYSTGIVILVSSATTPFTYTTGVITAYISGTSK